MCDSSEHVDHIVALKEAYDSGAANWTNSRKSQFANDFSNLWCLDASVNLSKSDHDLAEWSGGACDQRKHIATVTRTVKSNYGLSTDGAEANANTAALAAQCATSASTQTTPAPATTPPTTSTQSSPPQQSPQGPPAVDQPGDPFPAGRIVARRLEDGRTEFGYRLEGGELVLPSKRFFPTSTQVGQWLNSTPVEVDGVSIGRISARRHEDGRIEFSLIPTDADRFLPISRFFPVRSSGGWLRSTLIDLDG